MPPSDPPQVPGPRLWLLGLLGLCWLMAALVVILPLYTALGAEARYVPIEAEVVEVQKKDGALDRLSHSCSTHDDNGPRQVYVTYRYVVDGHAITSSAYDAQYRGELFCSEEPALARVAALKKAGKVQAYYDPENPSAAVLVRQDASEVYAIIGIFAVLGLGLGGFTLRQLLRQRAARALDV